MKSLNRLALCLAEITLFTAAVAFVPYPSFGRQRHGIASFSSDGFRPKYTPLQAATIKEVTKDSEERMSKSIDSLRQNLASIRTGRASASILDRVKVDYYGAPTPLNQMATITVPSAQQLSIEPYDRSTLNTIERAISESDLGLTPSNDGSRIRINIPALTEDRRKSLLKQCKAIGEECKVAIRNIRRDSVDSLKKMEKNGEISEDEMQNALDSVQKTTDKRTKDVDEIVSAKEKEVMTV